MVDLFTLMLVFLPIYPERVEGHVYAVNLLCYTQTAALNLTVYWALFLALLFLGGLKVTLTQWKAGRDQRIPTACSMVIGCAAVLVLALAAETYAAGVAFLLLIAKTALLFRYIRAGC